MNNRNILVISELYYPEDTSTGYFLTKIAEGLARYYSVEVLCSQPTYSVRGLRAPKKEMHNGVNIQRCRGTTLNKDIFIFRILNLLTISSSIFFSALNRIRKDDIVLVVTNPPLLPFLVNYVCQMKGARCILLIHDVYPDILVVTGFLHRGSIWTRIFARFTQHLYKSVSQIVAIGRDMEALVSRKITDKASSLTVISNWADLDLVSPGARRDNHLLVKLGIADRFVVEYAGNIGRTHAIDCLYQAVQNLKHDESIHFLFVGSGGKKRWLEQAIKQGVSSNITLLPRVDRDDLSLLLNACDIAIISFLPGMSGVSVPSRMYNIMAAGKPIIAVTQDDSELALVVKEENIGWVVHPGDINGIEAAILDARSNPSRLIEMGKRARYAAETKYSYDRAIASYRGIIQKIGNSHGSLW